ncbi:putative cell wall-binding protein/protocatechuate 3,4-dioxygenase beta subunit [Leifsonia shinshuensis]|nr:putative cell wall-binding protein/protocatechuate 3,4-dioxygenase beta subunit [Leifsonia shinshuensis]
MDTHIVTVIAKDSEGNPVKDAAVDFTPATGATPQALSATTDAAGKAETPVTSRVPGTYDMRATIGGVLVAGSPKPVTFVAGAAVASKSQLTVSTGPRTADGSDTHTLSVLAKDAQGNPVPDALVGFTGPVGVTLSASSARTDSTGVATVTVTSTRSGTYSMGATIGGTPVVSSPQPVTFVAGAADATMSSLAVSGGAQLADGAATHTATATVRDAFGNLVQNATVRFTAQFGATLSAPNAVSAADGTAAVTVTSTAPGQYSIHAYLGAAELTRSPGSVAFTAGLPSTSLSTFSVSSGMKVANGADTHTLTAVIKDDRGNLLPGVPVEFAVPGATLSAASALSDASGIARVTVTSTKARTYQASAALTGAAITGSPKDITFVAGVASAADSTISASPTSIPADGVTATTITVRLKDDNGNPLTAGGDRVTLSTTAGTLSAVRDNGDGTYTATLTGTDPATATLSFTVGGASAPATVKVTLDDVARYADAATSTLTVTPGSKIADGTDSHTLTATVRDAAGKPLKGVSVTFAAAPTATLSSTTDVSDAAGVATVRVTSTKAGSHQVAAAIAGASLAGSPQNALFAAGPASLKESTIAASPTTIPADGTTASTVTVTLKDANGNPLTSGGADVRLSTTAGTLSALRDNGDGTYSATLTGTDPAKATLSFSLGGSTAPSTITVTLADVDGVPDAGASAFSVTAGTRAADGKATHTLTATVKDANGKPVKNAKVTFTAAKGITLSAASDTTDPSGIASVGATSTKAGTYDVTASLSGAAINGSPKQIVFVAGALSLPDSTITASPTSIPADGTSSSTITVTLKDAEGNPLLGGGAGVTLSTTTGTLSSVTDNRDGTYTATLTGSGPGTAELSFAVGGTTAPVTIRVELTEVTGTPDASATRFAVSQGAKVADGKDAHTLSATVKDAKGKPVKGARVTFTAETGVTLSAASDLSDAAGVASVTAHTTRAGSYQVSAQLAGATVSGAPQAVVFIAGAAVANATTVTATPSSIRADGKAKSTITVRLVDQHGNALTTGGDAVAVSSTAGTVSGVTDNGDGSYSATLSGTKPASAVVSVTVNGTKASATATVVLLEAGIEVTRVAGSDRYGTSIEVSRREFPDTAPVVFVASGENFPDALSAGPAAAKAGGPILLTPTGFLPAVVKDEIARLKPQRIVLVGGTAAVSAAVEAEIASFRPSGTVVREWGGDRYGTSQAIAAAEFTSASRVYVATGADFPDALTAGAAAGSKDAPVLLVPGSRAVVDTATAATLRKLGASTISVVGGPAVVSAEMVGSLAQYGAVSRLAGADRFGTASAVNRDAFRTADTAMIASGLNFPDALSAAPWAATTDSPLYLARPECVPQLVLTDLRDLGVSRVYLIGGTAVLSVRLETLTSCG